MSAPRARRALAATYVGACGGGIAATLAATHHPATALIAALVAAALVISALVWALKQEERR